MTNYNKRRKKDQRRARRMSEQAWEAADVGELSRALKIIRRAADLTPANPVLWNDQGLLSLHAGDDEGAAKAFAAAISVAPGFAAAYSHLASIRARHGRIAEAVALQLKAVKLTPDSETYREQLASYRSLVASHSSTIETEIESANAATSGPLTTPQTGRLELTTRCRDLAWPEHAERLASEGVCRIPRFLRADECESLRQLFDDEERFAKTVVMNKPRFGQGVYRYFQAPLPPLIDALRQAMYPHLREIVNHWQQMLHVDERYPDTWEEFRAACAAAGQTTPTPLLIRYEAGGFNMPHCDLRGPVFFPVQAAIVLSQRLELPGLEEQGFTGGDFILCDEPERKETDRRRVPAGLGDAVLFCTASRLFRVGGMLGLKTVKHGVERITSGTRYVLGLPFHEYQ